MRLAIWITTSINTEHVAIVGFPTPAEASHLCELPERPDLDASVVPSSFALPSLLSQVGSYPVRLVQPAYVLLVDHSNIVLYKLATKELHTPAYTIHIAQPQEVLNC